MKDGLLGDTERPFGAGLCAVPRCPVLTRDNVLVCGFHWRRMPRAHQNAVSGMWRRWQRDDCTLGELRDVQRQAVDSIPLT